MKKHLQRITLVSFSLIFAIACKDDEPKIDPIIGEWELNEVSFSNAPSTFSRFNGQTDNNVYGETKYTITFNSDQSYLRELKIQGGTYEDDGEWELEDDELTLDQDDSDLAFQLFLDYEIEEEITSEDLVMSTNGGFRAYSDETAAGLQAALDTLDTDEKIAAFNLEYIEEFTMTVTLELEKQ